MQLPPPEEMARKLVYGILWQMPMDKSIPEGIAISVARKAIKDTLTNEQRKEGIAKAREMLPEMMEKLHRAQVRMLMYADL